MNNLNRKFIYFICSVSAMGGLLFGYDWVVIGGAKPFYEMFFGISGNPKLQGLAMSIAIIGCLIGAMVAGWLADRLGRKPMLIIAAILFLISAYATGAVNQFNPFLFARLLGGIAIGIASGLSPMYIAEISPSAIRGQLVSINQLTIVIGILAAQIANLIIAEPIPEGLAHAPLDSWNVQLGWRWMFWAEIVPAALFMLMVFFIPESPRFHAMKGQHTKAQQTLARVGGATYALEELALIESTSQVENTNRAGLRTLFSKQLRTVLLLGIIVAVFQQWCGTNVIFNYAQEIFSDAGYDLGDMLFNIVLTGITNVVFTFVAIYMVDRVGRRSLMLTGAAGLAIIYATLGLCYYLHLTGFLMIILVVGAIACYASTLGPVTWVLLAEIFPNKVRGVAMAICTFMLWTGCFTLTYSFPIINATLGSYGTFWIYAAICALCLIYFICKLPETKGKTLEQIEKEFSKN